MQESRILKHIAKSLHCNTFNFSILKNTPTKNAGIYLQTQYKFYSYRRRAYFAYRNTTCKRSTYLERSAGVDMSVHSLVVPVIAVVTAQCFEVVCRGPGNNV